MKKREQQGGFTLLELLIATAIFAATIVLVVSAFGLSSRHQREIRANRDLSQNIRYAMTEISDQVQLSANGTMVDIGGRTIIQNGNAVYNFAITNSPGSRFAVPDDRDLGNGDVLFVHGADNHCRYYFLNNTPTASNPDGKGRLAVRIDKNEGCTSPDWDDSHYLTDLGMDIESIEFRGTMNTKVKEEGAYTWIIITSKSETSEYSIPLKTRTVATIKNYGNES